MRYIKIEFTFGISRIAFQEIDEDGIVVRILDESGNEFQIPEVTESKVIDENPVVNF
jgi:hypothetical protein